MDTHDTPRVSTPTKENRCAAILSGYSLNAISKLFAVHASSVLKWIRAFAKTYAQKSEVLNTQVVRLELDEVWHYLGKKKYKLWIWKALDRNTGHLMDWECSGQDKQTLSKLIDRLAAFNVET